MKVELKESLLTHDFTRIEIIELCYIHNQALESEEYEICDLCKKEMERRELTPYEHNLLVTYLADKHSEFKYMKNLNGLLKSKSITA